MKIFLFRSIKIKYIQGVKIKRRQKDVVDLSNNKDQKWHSNRGSQLRCGAAKGRLKLCITQTEKKSLQVILLIITYSHGTYACQMMSLQEVLKVFF